MIRNPSVWCIAGALGERPRNEKSLRDVRSGKSAISIAAERSSQITEPILLNRAHWRNVYSWHTLTQRSRSTNPDTSLPLDSASGPFPPGLSPASRVAYESAPTAGESVNYDRDKRDTFFALRIRGLSGTFASTARPEFRAGSSIFEKPRLRVRKETTLRVNYDRDSRKLE